MTTQQLHDLLEAVPDTREIVIDCAYADGLEAAWHAAHQDASRALAAWRAWPGREGFSTYRAAQDRADAAQDALVAQAA
ncbi:MAG: hypothetical protein ACRDUX_10485 [Mycobacterium sp.]